MSGLRAAQLADAAACALPLAMALASGTPTLALPRRRERGQTEFGTNTFHHTASISGLRKDTISLTQGPVRLPLPLAGEGWGGGLSASEAMMAEKKEPTWKVSTKLRSNARALRKNSTDAERILWSELRDHRLNGASFRRQVPIGSYIADFICHAAKLVIELDGGQHFSDRSEAADAARSAVIEAKGFQVLRFSNYDVMTNRAGVLETIATAVAERAPSPTLPHKGGGSGASGANLPKNTSNTRGSQP
jgi:very-short-patch-repair endonuclease